MFIFQGSQFNFINTRENDELHLCEATNICQFDRKDPDAF